MDTRTREIWDCDAQRLEVWEENPARAAMLAYLEVVSLWHEQVERGVYLGVPALHRLPAPAADRHGVAEPSTLRSRPSRYMPDQSAGHYVVPGQIRQRFLAAA